jgi:hypothetical protein
VPFPVHPLCRYFGIMWHIRWYILQIFVASFGLRAKVHRTPFPDVRPHIAPRKSMWYLWKSVGNLCYSVFCHHNKIPEVINLQGGKVCLGSQYWRFRFMISWPHCSWPVARQHTVVVEFGRETSLTSRPGSKTERGGALESLSRASAQWPKTSHYTPPF